MADRIFLLNFSAVRSVHSGLCDRCGFDSRGGLNVLRFQIFDPDLGVLLYGTCSIYKGNLIVWLGLFNLCGCDNWELFSSHYSTPRVVLKHKTFSIIIHAILIFN